MSTQHSRSELNHGLLIPNLGDDSDTELLVDYAVEAEDAGWDGVFFGDHLIYPWTTNPDRYQQVFDPWITLSGIATRTDSIRLGTWISPVPRRQPWQLARNLATLDHLSDGRVILGAGMGTGPDFTRFGREYDQRTLGERFDEALEVMAGLWSGESVSYEGDHYTIDEAVLLPEPVQHPRIPIVIGGWWPFKAAFHRGARWDGIAPNWPSMIENMSVREVEELPEHIQEALAQSRSHEEEVREMLEFYHGITDDPGHIMLPTNAYGVSEDLIEAFRGLGVTWLLNRGVNVVDSRMENLDFIREGPPDW